MRRELERQPQVEQSLPEIDQDWKPNSTHLAILKRAKGNDGVCDLKAERDLIQNRELDPKKQKLYVQWNHTNIQSLERAGYLIRQSDELYIVNPLLEGSEKRKLSFSPGKKHVELLQQHKDGILVTKSLRKQFDHLSEKQKQRQNKFLDGMIKNLAKHDYVEKLEPGRYRLTMKGYMLIENGPSKLVKQKPIHSKESGPKISVFDYHLLKIIDKEGKIDTVKLEGHDRAESLKKRIQTWVQEGSIQQGILGPEFIVRLTREQELSLLKKKVISLDLLPEEQLKIMNDLRIFLNLSKGQIVKHIYNGNYEKADVDLRFLVQKKILERDPDTGVYVFTSSGVKLSDEMYPNAVRYKTKLHSRKEEMEHDRLLYNAYKHWERSELQKKNGTIIQLKNDRQLRSDDAKRLGHMQNSYPDLRVYYTLPGDPRTQIMDIEMDCGYDERTILDKYNGIMASMSNLDPKHHQYHGIFWSCNSVHQTNKVGKVLQTVDPQKYRSTEKTQSETFRSGSASLKKVFQTTKLIHTWTKDHDKSLGYTRKVDVFFMDKNGELQRVNRTSRNSWQTWR